MSKPDIRATGDFFTIDSTKFLENVDRVAWNTVEWNGLVATLDQKGYTLNNGIEHKGVELLWQAAQQSQVGKGSKTVEDTEVRNSKEILAEDITLQELFREKIEAEGRRLLKENLFSIVDPEFHFYKMVIYKEDDHFTWHMDSNHRENMFATMSVRLHVSGENTGGELVLLNVDNVLDEHVVEDLKDNERVEVFDNLYSDSLVEPSHPEENQVTVAVFYQDTPHMIEPVNVGYRISLIFDITTGNAPMATIAAPQLLADLIKLKSNGVKRVGFLCNHIYMGEHLQPTALKGTDRYAYELFKRYSTKIDLVELTQIDGVFYHADLLPLFHMLGPGVWCQVDWEEPTHLNCYSDQGDLITTLKRGKQLWVNDKLAFEPRYESGRYKAVADEYRLGDVLFFKSVGPARLSYCGDSELHLGNEGFWGTIYDHAAVIATL